MYIILKRNFASEPIFIEGSWPSKELEALLEDGADIIVISTYSNTVKIPRLVDDNGEVDWEWEDYRYNSDVAAKILAGSL